jgi:hypothetical protein
VPVSQYATLGLWNHSHSSLLKDLLLGVPLDEGACEQQAIQPPLEKIILPEGCGGLRRLTQIQTSATPASGGGK